MIITAIKYIFNNLWDKIDVCLVFKGNQEGRMIDLSTQGIFYFVMVSPVLCENGLKYSIFWNVKSHLYSMANKVSFQCNAHPDIPSAIHSS